jgi:hypothetical protein
MHVSISEAAELLARDMWLEGYFPEIDVPKNNCFEPEGDHELRALLQEKTSALESRLMTAVDHERLTAALLLRDFDDCIVPERTYVSGDDLCKWLQERGHEGNDFLSGWYDEELFLAEMIVEEVQYLRAASKNNRKALQRISQQTRQARSGVSNQSDGEEVLAAYKAAITENQTLKRRLAHSEAGKPTILDRPLPTRQRRTLLTIIHALCLGANIDSQARGAARRIAEMVEVTGATVTDETIVKVLRDIPDAIESRMK